MMKNNNDEGNNVVIILRNFESSLIPCAQPIGIVITLPNEIVMIITIDNNKE